LKREQIVLTDNLSCHKGEPGRRLIEERGCELLYLPPCSTNLSPIEEVFSKIKRFLHQIGA
jgi:transposase